MAYLREMMPKMFFLFLFSTVVNAGDFTIKSPPKEIMDVKVQDLIKQTHEVIPQSNQMIAGQDHIVLDKNNNRLIVFDMKQRIFFVDLKDNHITYLGTTPGIVGGAKFDPQNPNRLVFCASNKEGEATTEKVKNGIYELNLETLKMSVILDRVFRDTTPKEAKVYSKDLAPSISLNDSATSFSLRPFGICDDLSFSKDGKRIYIAEPYDTAGGGFGDEITGHTNQEEILRAKRNGKLWLLERDEKKLYLVGSGFSFLDGIHVLESNTETGEDTILFTELSRYNLIKAAIGKRVSNFSYVFENLPGMPNAIEEDDQGRLYLALNKIRNFSMNLMINFPIFKDQLHKLILKLPYSLKPITQKTGFLILEYRKNQIIPVLYSEHDGSVLTSITNVVPDIENNRLYFAIYDSRYSGINFIPLR